MKKSVVIPALVLCLLLTACGGKKASEKTEEATSRTEVLLTVDGREVPAWRYLCWLTHACNQMQKQYAAAGREADWSMAVDGGTLAEYVKERALADTVLYATVENWADRYGCETVGDANFSAEDVPLPGLTEEQQRELWAVGAKYAALYELYCTEGSALAPSQEDLAAFARESGSMLLDRILVGAGEDRERAQQRAAELFSRLNSTEKPAELFAALAAEGDDTAGPRLESDCGWEESLLTAARSLEVGQYSGILESEEGFSVLMRLEPEPALVMEEYFDSLLQAAAAAAVVTVRPEYHELDPAEFCVTAPKE